MTRLKKLVVSMFGGVSGENGNQNTKQQKIIPAIDPEATRRKEYELLFDYQLITQIDKKYPRGLNKILQNRKEKTIETAMHLAISKDNIPFLPVIKPKDFRIILKLIKFNNTPGYTSDGLIASLIKDTSLILPVSYIYDVDISDQTRGYSPKRALRWIEDQNRYPLSINDGLPLGIHTDILAFYRLYLLGSKYELGGYPGLYIRDNKPKIEIFYEHTEAGKWITPSYKNRD